MGDLLRNTLGSSIRERRKVLGLTAAQLADMTGTTQSTISKIELGDWSVSLDRLEPIMQALRLRIQVTPMPTYLLLDSVNGTKQIFDTYDNLFGELFKAQKTYNYYDGAKSYNVTRHLLLEWMEQFPANTRLYLTSAAYAEQGGRDDITVIRL